MPLDPDDFEEDYCEEDEETDPYLKQVYSERKERNERMWDRFDFNEDEDGY